jgi:universal stress protein E
MTEGADRQPRLARDLMVAADASEASGEGVRLAAEIAARTGAHVSVVHVRQRPSPGNLAAGMAAAEVEQALEDVVTLVHDGAAEVLNPAGVSWRFVTRDGGTAGPILVRAAEELGVDVIVLGSRRHSALHNLVVGSTAEYLVKHSPVPVLVAR